MPQPSHPTTRVLAMLELLQANHRIGGAELARRLCVDERTVRRYAARLDDLGVPVAAERGRHGGYRLMPGYRMPPLMLTDDEATAVVLGVLAAWRRAKQRAREYPTTARARRRAMTASACQTAAPPSESGRTAAARAQRA